MTRTARATFPRAIIKDRHESKNGLDKNIRKNGAGAHSWGSLKNEDRLEYEALEDEAYDVGGDGIAVHAAVVKESPPPVARSLSDQDIENARSFRKNALNKEGVDLAAIARTSAAVSTSPPNRTIPISNDANTSNFEKA